jgi:hypothetical protein
VILKEKLSGLSREVVAVKHQNCVWMALLFEDIDPLLDHCVHRCFLLQLLVGAHEMAVQEDRFSIWQHTSQFIDPKANLEGEEVRINF